MVIEHGIGDDPQSTIIPIAPRSHNIHDLLNILKEKIWHKRPILGDIMQRHSEMTVYEYAKDFLDVNKLSAHIEERREELIGVAQELISTRLGETVGTAVGTQLRQRALVSTIDHHGSLTHPFFLNANIIASVPLLELGDISEKFLVVFSFASVSLNNASAFPRGFIVHSKSNGGGELVRIPILPDKMKMGVVYTMPAYTKDNIDRAFVEIKKKERAGIFEHERAEQICTIIKKYYETDDILQAPDFVTQITRLNYRLWKDMFHLRDISHNSPAPQLVYLDIETLVTQVLLKYHINNQQSLIYRLMFDPSFHELILTYFDNLEGAFSTNKDKGTYLFWGVDSKMRRVRLMFKDKHLISPDGLISITYNPATIAEALRNKMIFPSMLLCYLMVSLYYGMKCLGGFCQVHDLTMIKKAWQDMLQAIGDVQEAQAIEPVQTKELGGDGMVLAYFGDREEGRAVPATGIDMLLEPVETRMEKYALLARKLKMHDVMNVLLPEIYTVLYPSFDREEHLTTLTPEYIFKSLELFDKVNGDLN